MTNHEGKYQPTPEEISAAEESMSKREKELTEKRVEALSREEGEDTPWAQFADKNGYQVVNVNHANPRFTEVEFFDPKVGDKEWTQELEMGPGNYISKSQSEAYFKKEFPVEE